MTKQEHITHWVETAEPDWRAARNALNSGDYLHCLFWAHLTIEKISKALWIKTSIDNAPPCTHNINKLWQEAQFAPTSAQIALAAQLNLYQLEGRYAEYTRSLFQRTTQVHTQQMLAEVSALRHCLLNELL